jgi:hypothetical protein
MQLGISCLHELLRTRFVNSCKMPTVPNTLYATCTYIFIHISLLETRYSQTLTNTKNKFIMQRNDCNVQPGQEITICMYQGTLRNLNVTCVTYGNTQSASVPLPVIMCYGALYKAHYAHNVRLGNRGPL